MRFLADENVSNLVIAALESAGHEVLSVRRSHPGSVDEIVLQLAGVDERILITEGQDFGDLVIRRQVPVLGVLLLELDRMSNESEARRVADVVVHEGVNLVGHFIVVEPGRIRMRQIR